MELWEMHTVGRPKKYETAEEIWEAALQYFQWVTETPLEASELVKYQGEAKLSKVPKMRAMTIDGLCLHMGISFQTWTNYRKVEEFLEVTTRVDAIIREQKFTGAAAELLNPQIIARDLGLRDGHEIMGQGGGPLQITRRIVDPK